MDSCPTNPTGEILGWSEEEYFGDTARISRSMLKDFASHAPGRPDDMFLELHPLEYYEAHIVGEPRPIKSTKALGIGLSTHAVLDGDTSALLVAPGLGYKKNDDKDAWSEWAAENVGIELDCRTLKKDDAMAQINQALAAGGRRLVQAAEMEVAKRCVEAVQRSPITRGLLDMEHESEVSLTWEDAFGLPMKARLDRWIKSGLIIELKTARSVDERAFVKSSLDTGLHWQSHLYCEAVEAATGSRPRFVSIVVRNDAPFQDVAVYQHGPAIRELARRQLEIVRSELAERLASEEWRLARNLKLTEIDIPDYMARALDGEVAA